MTNFDPTDIEFGVTEYFDFCSYCDKDLMAVTDRERMPSRFCCEEHRVLFHNERRKIERLQKRLNKAVMEMATHYESQEGSELRVMAAKALMHAQKLIGDNRGDIRYECTECGQTRYFPPNTGDICPFCQNSGTFRVRT